MSKKVTVIFLLLLSVLFIGGAAFLAVQLQQQQAPDNTGAAPAGEWFAGCFDPSQANFCDSNNPQLSRWNYCAAGPNPCDNIGYDMYCSCEPIAIDTPVLIGCTATNGTEGQQLEVDFNQIYVNPGVGSNCLPPACGDACTSNTMCPTGHVCNGGTCKIQACVDNPDECNANSCQQNLNVSTSAQCTATSPVARVTVTAQNLTAANLRIAAAVSVGNSDIDLASQWSNFSGPGLSASSAPWTDPSDNTTYQNAFGICDLAGLEGGTCPTFNAGSTVTWSFDVTLTQAQITTYQAGMPVGIVFSYDNGTDTFTSSTHTRNISIAGCSIPVVDPVRVQCGQSCANGELCTGSVCNTATGMCALQSCMDNPGSCAADQCSVTPVVTAPPSCGETCGTGGLCSSGHTCNSSTNLCALDACLADPSSCSADLCTITPQAGESLCGETCANSETCIGGSQCNTTTGLCALPSCISDPSSCEADQCTVTPTVTTPEVPSCGETCGTDGLCPSGHTCSSSNVCVFNACLSNPSGCTANLCSILPDTALFDDIGSRLLIGFLMIAIGALAIRTGLLDQLLLDAFGNANKEAEVVSVSLRKSRKKKKSLRPFEDRFE